MDTVWNLSMNVGISVDSLIPIVGMTLASAVIVFVLSGGIDSMIDDIFRDG